MGKALSYTFIIAGGGTGGHLFPGIAVAKELSRRFQGASIIFVVSRRKMESKILSQYGYGMTSIDIEGIKGRGWKKGFSVLLKMPANILRSVLTIKRLSPITVLGMGGYSSGPICLAAKFMGIATAIHEQNSYPGLTNRILSKFADRIFVSFEETLKYFKGKKVFLTGNPVREELFSSCSISAGKNRNLTVLVLGGSQGSVAINKAFAEALSIMKTRGKKIDVIHQTGERDYGRVAEEYLAKGIRGKLLPFIEDMCAVYSRADLVISRAGASTIFELAATRKPSILIPYPYAADQHQKFNALALVRIGGAEMICQNDLTGERIANILIKYIDNPEILREMGNRAGMAAVHDAARLIVDLLVELIRK
jgi:UDP-N-acetylglucosamine--N-acetylmuramyl-(pentapeptide) pyrophosphoryl-undecaprenol N-acetylglucosamine transferase